MNAAYTAISSSLRIPPHICIQIREHLQTLPEFTRGEKPTQSNFEYQNRICIYISDLIKLSTGAQIQARKFSRP